MIIPGSASQSLASSLAAELNEPLGIVNYQRFADGEMLVQTPKIQDRAIIVASTISSDAHIELLQLQDAVRRQADEVLTVIPYMGYARQDKLFETGEPISAAAMASAFSTNTDRILTVNPHVDTIDKFFDVSCTIVNAAPVLADPLPKLTDPLFLAPDEGAITLANQVQTAYGEGETDYFVKSRISDVEVQIQPSDAETRDRDIVLVDDIIATGSTMSTAISQLDNPHRIFVSCIHPVLAANAVTKLSAAGVSRIYGTDTIEQSVSTVSVASEIAAHV